MNPWYIGAVALVVVALLVAGFCFGFGTTCDPISTQVAFGTSPCMPPVALYCLRVALAAVFVSVLAKSLYDSWRDGYWFIFLTQQAMCLETVFFVALAVVARPQALARHYEKLPEFAADGAAAPAPEPPALRFLTALSTVCFPLSMAVMLLFWTLLTPFWKLCVVSAAEDCKAFPSNVSFFMHFTNAWLILLHSLVSRIPFRLRNAGWWVAFPALFVLWSLVHYALRIGVHSSDRCKRYSDIRDCPIYSVLDWHDPSKTLPLLLVIWLALGLAFTLVCYAGERVRDCADPAMKGLAGAPPPTPMLQVSAS